MSMITDLIERLKEEADGYKGYRSKRAVRVKHLLREAADTIEQLAAKVREDNAYQKSFEDIRSEIVSQKINRDKRFIEEIWWNSALQECLEIIDKHDPDKAGKESE